LKGLTMRRRKWKCRGKRTRPQNVGAYLRRSERNRIANETKHDHTRQRAFERRFESRDLPDSRAAKADASDGGRIAAGVRGFETRKDAAWYEAKVRTAAARLPKDLKRFRALLWAIYRNGKNRSYSIAELHKTEGWYRWGLKKLLDFFCGQ